MANESLKTVGTPNSSALLAPATDMAQKAAKAGKLKSLKLKLKFKPKANG